MIKFKTKEARHNFWVAAFLVLGVVIITAVQYHFFG